MASTTNSTATTATTTTTTPLANFLEAAAAANSTLISASILPCLVNWLKTNRQVEVTVEELMSALQIPVQKGSVPTVSVGMNATKYPDFLRGTGTSLVPDSKNKSSRGRKKAEAVQGPPCQYEFKRTREGEKCGKATEPHPDGLPYCNACRKKAGVKAEIARKMSGANATPPTRPTINQNEGESDGEGVLINLEDHPEGKQGYYIEPTTGFVLQILPDKKAVAVSICVGRRPDGKVIERELTEEEIKKASSMGFLTIKKKSKV